MLDYPEGKIGVVNYNLDDGTFADSTLEGQKAALADWSGQEVTLPFALREINNDCDRANQYFPIAWLPQAIGIAIGLATKASPYLVWQFGRISALLSYIFFGVLAIKLLPAFKKSFALLLVLPWNVYMASSLMSDGMLIVLIGVSVALTLKTLFLDEEALLFGAIAVVAISVFVLLAKPTYFPATCGWMVLPLKKLSAKRKLMGFAVLAFVTALYLWWHVNYSTVICLANEAANASFILSHITKTCARILVNIALLGEQIYGASDWIVTAVVVVMIIIFAAEALHAEAPHSLVRSQKVGFVGGAVVAILFALVTTFLFLLLTWNVVESQTWNSLITGFQVRYLCPLYPVLFYFIVLKRAKATKIADSSTSI